MSASPSPGYEYVYSVTDTVRAAMEHGVDETLALEFRLRRKNREQHFARRFEQAVIATPSYHLRHQQQRAGWEKREYRERNSYQRPHRNERGAHAAARR